MVDSGKRIIRVFPRKTKATPDDNLAVVNRAPRLLDQADEVHISVSFTWDLPRAEELASVWKSVGQVKIGGPATGQRGKEFETGKYLKPGFVITSRGCPNKCWFCSVWKRDGGIRELPIQDGYCVQDDNILACSEEHIRAVFQMLSKQKESAEFTGGLEAARLQDWHVDELVKIRPKYFLFAYDTPDDLEPLQRASRMLIDGGLLKKTNMVCRCYVFVGYPKDTYGKAESRIEETMSLGFVPYVMLYRDEKTGEPKAGPWRAFARRYYGLPMLVKASIFQEKRKHLFKIGDQK